MPLVFVDVCSSCSDLNAHKLSAPAISVDLPNFACLQLHDNCKVYGFLGE